MRKALEYHKPDRKKLEYAKDLIEQIAEQEGDVEVALAELNKLTGGEHAATEFAEYWGWTDLDSIAEQAFVDAPFVNDLTKEELIEIIAILKETFVSCEDNKSLFYEELLHRSLPLTDVQSYILLEEDNDKIAENMLSAAKSNVIML